MNTIEEPYIAEVNGKTAEVFIFLANYIEEKGYAPATREICAGVNLKSTSTVSRHLKKLQRLGFIEKRADCPRAISIVGKVVG